MGVQLNPHKHAQLAREQCVVKHVLCFSTPMAMLVCMILREIHKSMFATTFLMDVTVDLAMQEK